MRPRNQSPLSKPPSPEKPTSPWLTVLLFGLIAVSGFLFGLHKITDSDTLWHLKAGQLVLEQGPPHVDSFSFRTAGREWIDKDWLFQLSIYLVNRLFDFKGLSVLAGLMIALAWVLFLYGCWDERTGPLSACLFLFSLWAASDRLNLRPEIFSFAIMAAYFVILEKDRGKSTNLLFLLVPLQALWANIEGIWPIGLSIIGAYFAEAMVSRYVSRPWIERPEKPAPARLLALLALCTAACFANPYFANGFLFPLTLFREVSMAHYFKEAILELRPPFAEGDSAFVRVPFVIIAVLSCLSFILNFRKLRPAHVLLWTAFLFLASRATRNVGPFSLCACFFTAINSKSLFAHANSRLRAGSLATASALALFYFISLPTNKFYQLDSSTRYFGPGFPANYELERPVEMLKALGWKGKIWCDEISAGYLIWRGAPDFKVYVDGRLELYGPELMQDAFERRSDFFSFEQEDLRWNFDAAVFVRARSMDQGSLTLVDKLYADPHWALIYLDPAAALYLKDTPEQHALIKKYR